MAIVTTARGTRARAARRWSRRVPLPAALLVAAVAALPGGAGAEQASQPSSPAAGWITVGTFHSCSVISAALRCWGYGGNGQLGYGDLTSVGDDDVPASFGPIDLGRPVVAASAGTVHNCALLDDGAGAAGDGVVRCWGFGGNGRLGYGNTAVVGDDETPGAVGPVELGPGTTATVVSAGDGHSCAVLDDGTVRCWGFGGDGRLGYNATESIGDDELPAARGPIDFGGGLTAKTVATGYSHTCAILADDTVRCWGLGTNGRLGYGNTMDVGSGCVQPGNPCTPNPAAPRTDTVGPVDLGAGRTAKAITAGFGHTCAVLDDGTVRCWGVGASGRLGYGSTETIGDTETPGSVAPVDLGPGRTAVAISAGRDHTCAVLDDGAVRCWGVGVFGLLGQGGSTSIGDNETPGTVPPVDLGPGRTATAISAGALHTCARLDDASVRCWGYGANGRLGYCAEATIGDDETPGSVGPVALGQPGIAGATCPIAVAPPPPPPPAPPAPPAPAYALPPGTGPDTLAAALAAQRARARALRSCLRRVSRRLSGDRRRARALRGARRRIALRTADVLARQRRSACLRRHGRTPGRVTRLAARASGKGRITLSFGAPGTDGSKPPAARRYVVKQSDRPIRTARDFARAPALCRGTCSFRITAVGTTLRLTVTDLERRRRFHFAVAAKDNVSGRTGPRATTAARAG